jgi:hypothetical protein
MEECDLYITALALLWREAQFGACEGLGAVVMLQLLQR